MKKCPLLFFLLLCLLGGIVFTWPLTAHFFSSIPYTLKPIEGYERVPLMPGDHLQAYYWYWLLKDNLFGSSAFLTNPYEFNGPHGVMSTAYAFFPYSLLYVLFSPLGPLGAYNALILFSFLLCGLSLFLLARLWTKDFGASVLAGLIFAVFPYRVSHVAGGQLTGHVIFFLPLCLYGIEKTLASGRWVFGAASALCLFVLAVMDPHATYLAAFTLGIYLPARILLWEPFPLKRSSKNTSLGSGMLGVLCGGLALAFFLWMKYGRDAAQLPRLPGLFQALLLGVIATTLSWLFLSALIHRWTTLSCGDARLQTGRSFFSLMPLALYGFRDFLFVPRLGLILSGMGLILFFLSLGRIWWNNRDRMPPFDLYRPFVTLLSAGAGLGVATLYLLRMHSQVILPSVAGKGRSLHEVLLFSPHPANLFFWQDINREKFVFLGWSVLALAAAGIALLLKRHPKDPGKTALAGVLAFLGIILSLGPRLEIFPLYQTLYHYFPFFNYPRAPGRFLFIGIIFLCLLVALALSALREMWEAKGWVRAGKWFPFLLISVVLFEYHSGRPLGITHFPQNSSIYETIRSGLAAGQRVLELPIWPGDSHQSSAYEYTVTRTRRPMINGYAPVVHRRYVDDVFWPLFPLDFGEWGDVRLQGLKDLRVGMITFHDHLMIYPEKISPFPAVLALKRLRLAPYLRPITQDQGVFLFQVDPLTHSDRKPDPSGVTSPVSILYPANYLAQETGAKERDPNASGYYLLMDEQELHRGRTVLLPQAGGNVAVAYPGRDPSGYMVVSAHRFFPSGRYRARFRLQRGPAVNGQEIGRIEILKDRNVPIAEVSLTGKVKGSSVWEEIPIAFQLNRLSEVGFRLYFTGKTWLKFNNAIIGFADQGIGPGAVEAEDLFRQTGYTVQDPLASGQEAVLARRGNHPPLYLTFGPYRSFTPGRYRALFFLRLGEPRWNPKQGEAALLEIAVDYGKRVFARRKVQGNELTSHRYRAVTLDFAVPFPCELEFRTKFLNQQDILVDRIAVFQQPDKENGR